MAGGQQLFEVAQQRARLQESVADMREWTPEEVRILLIGKLAGQLLLDLQELDEYQRGANVDLLAAEPFSPAFKGKYGEDIAKALENNTAFYEPEVEDKITEDDVWQRIQLARRDYPNNNDLVRAQRVRRSLVAFSIFTAEQDPAEADDSTESDEDPDATVKPDAA